MDSTFQCAKEMTDSYSSRDSALIYWRLLIPKVQFKDFFVCMFGSDDFQPQCCISTPFNQLWQLWSLPYHHLLNHFELDQVNSANLLFELWSFFSVLVCYRKCREEQCCKGQCRKGHCCKGHCREGHWYMMVLDQKRAVLGGIWWYWVSMRQYWLVIGDTGSL